ncbi:hypothetical protein BDN72DRAFT_831584 [Pluteus cervinus]|uniref:Uncharacterized protein n=1 Tax=Pluteus cervinus TaxID=181527 RepID=A0ACD3BEP9_9AGAR|nr:hypothetical protein BDN72DRAFT_831584 [Pluteus cervinus]
MVLQRYDVDLSPEREWATSQFIRVIHLCQLAATCLALYDHLITLDLEIELVWAKRWSWSKVMFLICRYLGGAILLSEASVYFHKNPTSSVCLCTAGVILMWFGMLLGVITTQIILQTRIRALYGNKPKVSFWVGGAFGVEIITMITLYSCAIASTKFETELQPGLIICDAGHFPTYSFLIWVPVLAFETLLFILAFRISYRHYSQCADTINWNRLTLLEVLLRDNFIYFLVAFVTYLVTLIAWLQVDSRYHPAIGSFTFSITIIMGSRLVLNLSEAFHRTGCHFPRISTIWPGGPLPPGIPPTPSSSIPTRHSGFGTSTIQTAEVFYPETPTSSWKFAVDVEDLDEVWVASKRGSQSMDSWEELDVPRGGHNVTFAQAL